MPKKPKATPTSEDSTMPPPPLEIQPTGDIVRGRAEPIHVTLLPKNHPPGSILDRMTSVNQLGRNILTALEQLSREMRSCSDKSFPSGNPRWEKINDCLVSLATYHSDLKAVRENLNLFSGLRPDGVSVSGMIFVSWHHGVINVFDAISSFLHVRVGIDGNVAGNYLWVHQQGNWLLPDLGLPESEQLCRSRTILWQRAIECFNLKNVFPLGSDEPLTMGWSILRELDVWSLQTQLRSEFMYASSQHSLRSQSERVELCPTAEAVLEILRAQRGKGKSGKALVIDLRTRGIEVEETTLRRHIVPKLKSEGVANHRSRGGYYID